MVLRRIDGFDHYVTADMAMKWTTVNNGTIATGAARSGTQGMRNATGASAGPELVLDAQATWIVGCAFRMPSTPPSTVVGVALRDGTTTQVDWRWGTDNNLSVTRNGTVLATTTTPFSVNVWHYIELKVTINNTTGSYDLHVDGTSVLSATGQNTRASANNSADRVRLTVGASSALNLDIDDFYICDGTGTINNDFLGDCKIETLYPNGAGTATQWTPDTGSNYARVNEALQNADTSYVASSTVGQIDTYAYGDLTTASGTIKAVQVNPIARKDDAGTRQIAAVARPGSTNRIGATQNMTSSYADYPTIWESNPDTSAAWTFSQLNATEFGVDVIA